MGQAPANASSQRHSGSRAKLARAFGRKPRGEPSRAKTAPPPWKRHLRFTREGKYFLGVTLGVGLAAINTGNNLLYLLLGMLLALMLVSGVLSELALRDLRVTRRLPARAQVGRPHLVEIEVRNAKKRMPSYAIEVEDLRAGQPADKRCFFLKVAAGASQVAAYRRTPTRRGLELHTGFRIATRFPFGFFEKSRELQAPGELLIYPQVDRLRPTAEARPRSSDEGSVSAARVGGDEPLGLRPQREGEDLRDVFWKRRSLDGGLLLRERAQSAAAETLIMLDDLRSPPPPGERDPAFESLVRDAASRVVAHIKRGDLVRLRTTSGARCEGSPGTGADPVLRFLALIEPSSPTEANEPQTFRSFGGES